MKLPNNIFSGNWKEGHVQGIAVDAERGFVYYSFTTILLKTDFQGNALARKLGLSSVYQASTILTRPSRPQTAKMEINALTVGGMAFVTTPYEMFSTNCMYIKEHSPFDMTFVVTCANENFWYTPSADAYDYGCYESYVSYFAKGTAESTSEKLVEMLNGLK